MGWFRAIAAVVALFLVNLAATFALVAAVQAVGWPTTTLESKAAVRVAGAIIGEVVFLVLLVLWLRRRGISLDGLGLRIRPPAWALVGAVGFAATYGFLTLSNPGIRQFAGTLGPLRLEMIIAALVAGVVEEVTCRGYVMWELNQIPTPVGIQILASGVLFGLAHFNYSLYGVVSATVIGVVFAVIYAFGRRSLLPAIAGHAAIDLIIEPGLILWVLAGFPIPH